MSRTVRGCVPVLLLLGGCRPGPSFEFDLRTAAASCAGAPTGLPQGLSVRVTFLRRSPDKATSGAPTLRPSQLRAYRAVCEHTFAPTGTRPPVDIYVPTEAGTETDTSHYTIRIDAFKEGAAGQLLYSAQLEGVDLGQHGPVPFVLRPTRQVDSGDPVRNGFSCSPVAAKYRAFHSATLLPNGQVLIFGGLAADHTDAIADKLRNSDEVAFATNKAEIYDPFTSSFYEVAVSSSSGHTVRPRAFHQAFLLPSPPMGPYRVLLVGGVGPKPDCQGAASCAALRVGFSRPDLPFLFTPHEQAVAVELGLLTYTPPAPGTLWTADYVRIAEDSQHKSLPAQLLPAGAGEDVIAVGGGTTNYSPPGGFDGELPWLLLSDATTRAAANDPTLGRRRAGHAVARVGAATFLVVGGTMTGAIGDNGDVAELVSLGAAATPVKATDIGAFVSTAWHTLTSTVGDADLAAATAPTGALWAGGYKLRDNKTPNMRIADAQTSQMAQLELLGATLTARSVAAGTWIAVAYHEATALYDGSVLLSGGNADKSLCANNVICPQDQLATYSKGSDLRVEPQRLAVKRFGHRVTRMLDNTLLITGGVSAQALLTRDAEIFSPRNSSDSGRPVFDGTAPDCAVVPPR